MGPQLDRHESRKIVRAALIQAHANLPKDEALAKHVDMIEQAAAEGTQIGHLNLTPGSPPVPSTAALYQRAYK